MRRGGPQGRRAGRRRAWAPVMMLPAPALLDKRHALFLDVDGTLIELAPTPEAVVVPADLATLLNALHEAFAGALALVSGRDAAALARLLPGLRVPVLASYGAESPLWPMEECTLPEGARAACAAGMRAHVGAFLEEKSTGLALHWRTAAEPGAAQSALTALAAQVAADHAARVVHGHCVAEVVFSGWNKSRALEQALRMAPFSERVPVMVGDDVPDQAAMRVALEGGGFGVAVGREAITDAARFALLDPAAVRRWLRRSLAKLTTQGTTA